jgi:hypothetical protein
MTWGRENWPRRQQQPFEGGRRGRSRWGVRGWSPRGGRERGRERGALGEAQDSAAARRRCRATAAGGGMRVVRKRATDMRGRASVGPGGQ